MLNPKFEIAASTAGKKLLVCVTAALVGIILFACRSAPELSRKTPAQSEIRTTIGSIDVVNRALDWSQVTLGMEVDYRDELLEPMLAVEVLSRANPNLASNFKSEPARISQRPFVLIPVRFDPAGLDASGTVETDTVVVYLEDKSTGRRHVIREAPLMLKWSSAKK